MNAVITKMSATPLRQVKKVGELLFNEQARQQLASVAAKHMSPERLMRVVANAIRTTPKLQECDPLSMLGALMQCAQLGLEPNTVLGHAYLIPFENKRKNIVEVQLIIGYKGLADLARRSGQVIGLHADVVYSDDELWTYEYGSEMHLRHKPGPRKGEKTHAYCHVTLKDGQAFVVIPWAEVMSIRDKSQGWQSAKRFGKTADAPWSLYEDRMAAKTAVRALANHGEMPLSIEFQDAMAVDEAPVDYAGYAQNPGGGAALQSDTIDNDTGEVLDGETVTEKAEPETKQIKPAVTENTKVAEAVKESAKPAETKPTAEVAVAYAKIAPERLEQLANTILADLSDAGVGNTEGVLAMYEMALKDLSVNAPDLMERIANRAASIKAGE